MPGQTVPLWITIAGSLSVGSFIGGLISQLLSSRQRHQEWVKDNKKLEWRELISALSQSFHYIQHFSGYGIAIGGDIQKELVQADVEARRAIESRIFIAHQVRQETVFERWQLLSGEKDWPRMVEFWNSLHSALIAAAHKDLDVKEHVR